MDPTRSSAFMQDFTLPPGVIERARANPNAGIKTLTKRDMEIGLAEYGTLKDKIDTTAKTLTAIRAEQAIARKELETLKVQVLVEINKSQQTTVEDRKNSILFQNCRDLPSKIERSVTALTALKKTAGEAKNSSEQQTVCRLIDNYIVEAEGLIKKAESINTVQEAMSRLPAFGQECGFLSMRVRNLEKK